MAGIYIHIPFCKQACHYCNFHFSTSLRLKTEILATLLKEIALQKDYLPGKEVSTIYLGGGTPSLLTAAELNRLFTEINRFHHIRPDAEITLEANPDDLDPTTLSELRQTPVNRLSVGVQSFSDTDLLFMNRAHHAGQARQCIEDSLRAGFTNLSIDLIYGSPTTSHEQWAANLDTVLGYEIPHLSCYCLTVEPNTALHHFVKTGNQPPVDEERATAQFEYLMDKTGQCGYEHYEISNFAKPGWQARHNTAYWQGIPYLGLGPSAHSFDGATRQWNIANNARYIRLIAENEPWFERETLSPKDHYNEYVMTSMRTSGGCKEERIDPTFLAHFRQNVRRLIDRNWVEHQPSSYRLTRRGKHFADQVALELFAE